MIKCITNVTVKTVTEGNRRKLMINGIIIGVSIVLMAIMFVVAQLVNTTVMHIVSFVTMGIAFVAVMIALIFMQRFNLEYYSSGNGYRNEYEFYQDYLIVTKKVYGKEDVSYKIPYADVSELRETENYLIICTGYHEDLPVDKRELSAEDCEEVLSRVKALCAKYSRA